MSIHTWLFHLCCHDASNMDTPESKAMTSDFWPLYRDRLGQYNILWGIRIWKTEKLTIWWWSVELIKMCKLRWWGSDWYEKIMGSICRKKQYHHEGERVFSSYQISKYRFRWLKCGIPGIHPSSRISFFWLTSSLESLPRLPFPSYAKVIEWIYFKTETLGSSNTKGNEIIKGGNLIISLNITDAFSFSR